MHLPTTPFAFLLAAASFPYLSSAATPTNTTPNLTCTHPTGLSNTFIPVPLSLTPSYRILPTFATAHQIFLFDNLPAAFSEASIGTFCLEQCVAYQPDGTTGPCLSFNVNLGKPVPPTGNGGPTQWFCSGFDNFFDGGGEDFESVDVEESFLFPISVNRGCGGIFRAY